MPSLRVSELFVYPVKSARGIALTEAIVGDRGIEHDRRFMIVDADGRFLTQREHPTLALLETRIHDDTLTLHAPQHGTLDVPLRPTEGSPRQVKVWRSTCEAIVASEASAPFFSDLLGTAAELVY
ncbi:MAG: MOSC domain-containing protein, partial [Minicystis sp.]